MGAPYTLVPTAPVKLLDAATTGTGGVLLLKGECARVTVVVQGSAVGITTGAVSIEEAFYEDLPSNGGVGASAGPQYAGTWSVIQSVSGASVTSGSQQIVHIFGSAWAVRARISTAIGATGTVTVWAYGN